MIRWTALRTGTAVMQTASILSPAKKRELWQNKWFDFNIEILVSGISLKIFHLLNVWAVRIPFVISCNEKFQLLSP